MWHHLALATDCYFAQIPVCGEQTILAARNFNSDIQGPLSPFSINQGIDLYYNIIKENISSFLFQSVRKLDEKINYTVDLSMFMNPSPIRVNPVSNVTFFEISPSTV